MLRTPSSGGAGTMLGEGRGASIVSVMLHTFRSPRAALCIAGRPGFPETPEVSEKPRRPGSPAFAGDDNCVRGHREAHQPNHSGLRGSSTDLTFSSLIVPLPMRSLMSPSVAPDTLER